MSPIKWPEVGKVAPHYLEHGIILLDEAAKLQAMARQKPIPINVISPFIDRFVEYIRKTREQPTMQELLMEDSEWLQRDKGHPREGHNHQARMEQHTTKRPNASHSIQALRWLTEKDIKESITRALTAEPATTNLANQVTAAKQLKSGDIIIYYKYNRRRGGAQGQERVDIRPGHKSGSSGGDIRSPGSWSSGQ
jgi:hypothetical protein